MLLATAALAPIFAKDDRITLGATDVDRAGQVVSFKAARQLPRPAALRGKAGLIPLQVAADGTATFMAPAQKAGESLTFEITAGETAGVGVQAKADQQRVHVTLNGVALFDYQMDKEALPRPDIKPEFKRAGYIHPVFSPTGKIVTDDYPSNHVHHHGIWAPWTKTSFQGRAPDFWNMGTRTGTVEFVSLDRTWNGRVHGGFVARHKAVDLSAPSPVVALNETWEVVAYDAGSDVRIFDLTVTQTCATNDPLKLPKYRYGGFGFRGAAEWNGPGEAALFLTSEGETNRIKGNDTRGRWCYLGGKLDGAVSGTAILGHPDNFRAPQPMRLHNNMPYMSYVPQSLGEFAIEPGRPYVARFRFVVFDGAADRAKIDAWWNGFARPAVVSVSAP